MNKFFYFAVLYVIIGLTFASVGGSFLSHLGFGQHSDAQNPTHICSNNTIAQSYLSKVLALITTLQANATSKAVLQLDFPNFVSYLQNPTNQLLLSINCTAFVNNLKAAQSADEKAENVQKQIAHNIQEQFEQVVHTATGNNHDNELNSHSNHGKGHH